MNKEQLNKINRLVISLDDLEKLLSEAHCFEDVLIRLREDCPRYIAIESKQIEPILIAHRDKIKAELKELGYED